MQRRRLGASTVVALLVAGVLGVLAEPSLAASPPALNVRAGILIEESTGRVLYGSGAQRELPIASTTKLMTALLTLEQVRLGRIFTQNDYLPAAGDSQIGLVPGERMSAHDLLLALLLPSGDDAAEDLAYNVGRGSVARFVGMMNVRARQLKLGHTHYSTPSGLDTPGNYSSPSDLVKLASFLREKHAFFAHAVALPRAVLRTGNHVRVVVNRNDLVARVRWVSGVKTGHTSDAGYVLVGSGTRGGMTLLSAVLGTSSESARDSSTLALLGYGFANFRLVKPVVAGSVIARPTVRGQPGATVDVLAASALRGVIGRSSRLTKRVELPRRLAGPLPRHAVVGTLLVLEDGRPIAHIRLLLARALPAVTPVTLARLSPQALWLGVLLAALLIGVGGVALTIRRRGGRGRGGEWGSGGAHR